MSSRLKISLALLVGFVGLAIAGANLPVDTQLTIRTKLGKRTQPHWLVPADSKIVRTEGGSGLIRLLGGLVGCTGFATAMHLAGSDERQQRLFWSKQVALDGIEQKEGEVSAEINAGVRLKKLQMDAQADIDFYSLQVQGKFREAIGFTPTPAPAPEQPALPHGKPGTLDEFTNPGDKIETETSEKKIISSSHPLTQSLLKSQISPAVFAGFLKLIGAPGSGKTTMTSALLRCRIYRGHALIIVNPHKRKSMYRNIERHLVIASDIYGVGVGDEQRARSLKAGLDEILRVMSNRYDEYQNKNDEEYSHYPLTLLLEEVGEWEASLSFIMSAADADRYLQAFWKKLFIAARKAKMFPLVTAQIDTQAMFRAKGLSPLIKESGAVTLFMIAEPDLNSEDGWKPSGHGKLKLPNMQPSNVVIPDVRALIPDVDDFWDCYYTSQSASASLLVEPVVEIPPTSTTPPPPLHLDLHQLEALMHQDSTSFNPIPKGWQFPDPMQPLTPGIRAVVVNCKRSGLSQNAAILAVWGLTKSGSDKRYEAARNHYQSVFI